MQGRRLEAEALEREMEEMTRLFEYSTPLLLHEAACLRLALIALVLVLGKVLQSAFATVARIYRLRQLL
jgi:hypothetical protein